MYVIQNTVLAVTAAVQCSGTETESNSQAWFTSSLKVDAEL